MIRFLRSSGLVLLTVVAASAQPEFREWVDDVTAEWMRLDPQLATTVQHFRGAEQDALDRELTAVTAAHRAQRIDLARRALDQLQAWPLESLSPDDRTSAQMLGWLLQDIVATAPFARHDYVFQQFRGLQVTLVNFLTQAHPIRNARDAENYLARLRQVSSRLDDGIREARLAGDAGIRPPRFIIERTLEQIEGFLAVPPAENVLVRSFADRTRDLGDLEVDRRAAWIAEAEQVVRDAVRPAFARVAALLREQLPAAGDGAGLMWLPDGADAYRQALRRFTTTDLTPDEIHAIGLREVSRLESEMDAVLRVLGYADGPVEERYRQLELARQPAAEPDPRPALLAEYAAIVRDAQQRAAAVFELRPRAPVEVRREPPFTEKTAAAHYSVPAPDGTRPGIFWVPLPGPKFDILRMRSLAYHEAVPGHHFQVALQQEMTSLPRFRRDRVFGGLSVYVEGWALYAERLADELGWYEGDLPGRLGYLSSQLFRARRLVVDTGLHAKGWTREQAIAYGIRAQEVERYVVFPGQACSYMVGQLRLLALRERAQAELGPQFSLGDFHTVVLRTGAVPLETLEQVVTQWIGARRAR